MLNPTKPTPIRRHTTAVQTTGLTGLQGECWGVSVEAGGIVVAHS